MRIKKLKLRFWTSNAEYADTDENFVATVSTNVGNITWPIITGGLARNSEREFEFDVLSDSVTSLSTVYLRIGTLGATNLNGWLPTRIKMEYEDENDVPFNHFDLQNWNPGGWFDTPNDDGKATRQLYPNRDDNPVTDADKCDQSSKQDEVG